MRAVVYDRYGDEDVLRLTETPAPTPGPGQVLVRVAATSMNPSDRALRAGELRRVVRLRLPFTPGSDVAGVVEQIGPDVLGWGRDQAVWAMQPPKLGGGCAELVVVRAGDLAVAPASVPLGAAAALPLVGLTALQALRDKAELRPGQRLLVHGAGGGVGTAAVQIGRQLGAQVTAVAGRRHATLLEELGADEVHAREDVDLSADPGRLAGRFDVVLDAVALLPGRVLRRLLSPGGVAVSTDPSAGVRSLPSRVLRPRSRVRGMIVRPSGSDLRLLGGWVDTGALLPVVEQTLPLALVAQAHRDSARKQAQGKTVLVVADDLAQAERVVDVHEAAQPATVESVGVDPALAPRSSRSGTSGQWRA